MRHQYARVTLVLRPCYDYFFRSRFKGGAVGRNAFYDYFSWERWEFLNVGEKIRHTYKWCGACVEHSPYFLMKRNQKFYYDKEMEHSMTVKDVPPHVKEMILEEAGFLELVELQARIKLADMLRGTPLLDLAPADIKDRVRMEDEVLGESEKEPRDV